MPERLDEEELADWRAGRNAVYQLAALTIGRASLSPTRKPSLKGLSGATRRLIRRRRRWSLKAFRQGVSGAKTDRAQPAPQAITALWSAWRSSWAPLCLL
jgi:hypothetical protein